jgi:hypothetical protein
MVQTSVYYRILNAYKNTQIKGLLLFLNIYVAKFMEEIFSFNKYGFIYVPSVFKKALHFVERQAQVHLFTETFSQKLMKTKFVSIN